MVWFQRTIKKKARFFGGERFYKKKENQKTLWRIGS
jgi:hypothetical protein